VAPGADIEQKDAMNMNKDRIRPPCTDAHNSMEDGRSNWELNLLRSSTYCSSAKTMTAFDEASPCQLPKDHGPWIAAIKLKCVAS